MRQPDIEIYLKDADVDHKAIAAWLTQALGRAANGPRKARPTSARPATSR